MGKLVKAKPNARRRLVEGKDPEVGINMPPDLIKAVEAWAENQGASKSGAVRHLVERGLQAWIEERG